ncbi:hypothetical protein C3L33_04065, partial [Rhododendron williamsianum]
MEPAASRNILNKPRATEEGGGGNPDGESAMLGPRAATWNGSGGLRLEGMVGSGDSAGGGPAPPGEGKSGVISGDKAGKKREEKDLVDVLVQLKWSRLVRLVKMNMQ